jgi:gamma-glutamylcyclotransferase (GGCT)/AIG2-like uncharacterized protein YtfP
VLVATFGADQASCLLFVYGSLKRGRANHHELRSAAYVSNVSTAPCFALQISDGYPALVPGSRAITGELYRIALSALSDLDEFEGHGYVRQEIELATGVRALAYLSRVADAGDPYPGDEWPAR